MSEQLKESLSAVMDGEAETFEVRRVLDECAKDEGLAQTWARYHLVGSVLRGEQSERQARMPDAIWAALEEPRGTDDPLFESAAGESRKSGWARLLGPVAGIAVAATVAFGIVVSLDTGSGEVTDQPDLVVTNPVEQRVITPDVSTSDLQRANAYYLEHHRLANTIDDSGMLRFARPVPESFDEE